jgi:hypothetical protein
MPCAPDVLRISVCRTETPRIGPAVTSIERRSWTGSLVAPGGPGFHHRNRKALGPRSFRWEASIGRFTRQLMAMPVTWHLLTKLTAG